MRQHADISTHTVLLKMFRTLRATLKVAEMTIVFSRTWTEPRVIELCIGTLHWIDWDRVVWLIWNSYHRICESLEKKAYVSSFHDHRYVSNAQVVWGSRATRDCECEELAMVWIRRWIAAYSPLQPCQIRWSCMSICCTSNCPCLQGLPTSEPVRGTMLLRNRGQSNICGREERV